MGEEILLNIIPKRYQQHWGVVFDTGYYWIHDEARLGDVSFGSLIWKINKRCRELIDKAVQEERKACARSAAAVVEKYACKAGFDQCCAETAAEIVEAILARNK